MRTALVIIAMLAAAFLATVFYHRHVVMGLTADLQAERGAHAITRSKLTACQSASAAACAVARAQEGKADAREALSGLIAERKKK